MFELSRSMDRRDIARGFQVVNIRRESRRREFVKLVKTFKSIGWTDQAAKAVAADAMRRAKN